MNFHEYNAELFMDIEESLPGDERLMAKFEGTPIHVHKFLPYAWFRMLSLFHLPSDNFYHSRSTSSSRIEA